MQNKIEKSPPVTPVNSTTTGALGLSPEVHTAAWNGANFTAVAAITSAAVISVQSPMKTFLMNLTRNNNPIPSYNGGPLSFFKILYSGTPASFGGSAARTIYVTGTKGNKPVEGLMGENLIKEECLIKEENNNLTHQIKFGYVATSAFGDLVVTQVPESLSQLRKIPGLLPENFKWYAPYNTFRLMFNGFTPRYGSGIINYAAMLQFESWIAPQLPIKNKVTGHFVAGAVSGGAASVGAYPFAVLKDYVLAQSTVNNEGRLLTQSSFTVLKKLFAEFTKDPKQNAKIFVANATKQLPIRIGLTSGVFAIVSGVGETLGSEPLVNIIPERLQPANPQRFFSNTAVKTGTAHNHSPVELDAMNPFK